MCSDALMMNKKFIKMFISHRLLYLCVIGTNLIGLQLWKESNLINKKPNVTWSTLQIDALQKLNATVTRKGYTLQPTHTQPPHPHPHPPHKYISTHKRIPTPPPPHTHSHTSKLNSPSHTHKRQLFRWGLCMGRWKGVALRPAAPLALMLRCGQSK